MGDLSNRLLKVIIYWLVDGSFKETIMHILSLSVGRQLTGIK